MGPAAVLGLQAGGQVLNSLIQSGQARRNINLQNKYNKEAAVKQFQFDTMAWNRQNEYNSPEQVMARYKAAGLNPNLIYGGGVGNTAGTAPSQKVPEQSFAKPAPIEMPTGVLGTYQDWQLKKVQIDNAKKQYDILVSQDRIKKAEAEEAEKYFYGRSYSSWSKGKEGAQKWGWLSQTDNNGKSKGYSMYDTQLDAKAVQNQATWKKISEMDANIALKNKMIDWYDADKISRMFGQFATPAMGIIKGFMGFGKGGLKNAKSAPALKGVSSKFTSNWSSGKNLQYDLSKWE